MRSSGRCLGQLRSSPMSALRSSLRRRRGCARREEGRATTAELARSHALPCLCAELPGGLEWRKRVRCCERCIRCAPHRSLRRYFRGGPTRPAGGGSSGASKADVAVSRMREGRGYRSSEPERRYLVDRTAVRSSSWDYAWELFHGYTWSRRSRSSALSPQRLQFIQVKLLAERKRHPSVYGELGYRDGDALKA